MKVYCLLVVLCCCQTLEAQQKKIDSLQKLLEVHSQEDTVRLNVLIGLSAAYQTEDPDKGLIMGDQAALLARRLSRKDKLASALSNKAWNFDSKGQDSAALEYFGQTLAIQQQEKNELGIARTRHNIGIIYFNLSDYPLALENQQKALDYFKQAGDKVKAAYCLNSIGVVYQYVSDYPKALEYYLQALSIYEQIKDTAGMAATLTNTGIFYKNIGKFDKAREDQQKAVTCYDRIGDKQGKANCLANLGVICDEKGDPSCALSYYQQALSLSRSIGYQSGIASNLANIGTVYIGLSDYSRALENLHQSLTIYQLSGEKEHTSEVLAELARIYANAPDTVLARRGVPPRRRYTKAFSLLDSSLAIAKEIGALERQELVWDYRREIREKQRDFAGALNAYKQYVLLRDSVSNTEKAKEITRKEMQFDFDKKQSLLQAEHDKQQALALAEINRQRVVRNSIIAGSLLSLLAALAIFVLYKKRRDAKYQEKEAKFKAQVADTEMKALRAQMNPHFIFNSLNSISDFISKNDIKQADYYLTRFARLMRLILENSESKEVSLADDLKALEMYIQLENLRLNKAFSYEIRVDKQIDRELTQVPPLILQPFVENSIWHGIAGKQGTGQILIDIRKEGEMINCVVEDNGVGRKKEKDSGSRSLGIKITTSRINIINKLKNSNASLTVTDLEQGLRTEVRLPLELRF
jgi:tetratricopeptide (TPR) repeat protein